MIKFAFAALCLLAVANAGVFAPARVSRKANPFGVVEGILPCLDTPSAGLILEVRVTDCDRVPCQLVTGRTYVVEIDFIPLESHPSLDLKVTLIHDGEKHHIIDGNVPGSGVEAGGRYTFNYPIEVEGFIQGPSDLQIEISGAVSQLLELCGIAGIYVIGA